MCSFLSKEVKSNNSGALNEIDVETLIIWFSNANEIG